MSQISWMLTALLLVVVVGFTAASPLTIVPGKIPLNVVVAIVFGIVGAVYTYIRFDPKIAALCDTVALLSAFASVAAVHTYVMTTVGAAVPFWDARLLAADRALGLDWRAYLTWLNSHPALGSLLDQSYRSVFKQLAVLIVSLVVLGLHRRLQIFTLAAQLCLIVCGAAPAFIPVLGVYAFLHVDPTLDHLNIPLTVANVPVPEILQLRGPTPVLRPDYIEGIINFPSFHLALVILFAWAFWSVPVLRWGALALNLCMAAATPLSGGHYFVDLIGGGVLAVAALAGASRLCAWIEAGPAMGDTRASRLVPVALSGSGRRGV